MEHNWRVPGNNIVRVLVIPSEMSGFEVLLVRHKAILLVSDLIKGKGDNQHPKVKISPEDIPRGRSRSRRISYRAIGVNSSRQWEPHVDDV